MLPTAPLYSTQSLRVIETAAARLPGGDDFALMQRAGEAAWREALAHWPQAQSLLIACGPGNNGGDGYVLARYAQMSGRRVRVAHAPGHAARSALAQRACAEYVAAGGRVDAFDGVLPDADLIVDAIFGIGLAREPDAPAQALIDAINAAQRPVLALDVPSGLDADRGDAPGAVVRATRTLEFIAGHPGTRTGIPADCVGTLSLATLEVPAAAFDGVAAAAGWLPPDALAWVQRARARGAHKGMHGHVLCIGGNHGTGGAIVLAAEAALRSGTGLVSVATRAAHVPALLARRPECMALAVEGESDLAPLLQRCDAVAIGPGLGRDAWARMLFAAALDAGKPLVVDADALTLLAETGRPLPSRDAVLTPHPGEAARLLGSDVAAVQRDRFAAAQTMVERFGSSVVLKGAGSIVAAPDALPRVIGAGNPGMGVGGMGDVLTGVIAALRAQGHAGLEAAALGALLHACAGDRAAAAGERGMLPSDLFPWLRTLVNPQDRHG